MTAGLHTACNQSIRQSVRQGAASLGSDAARSVSGFVLGQVNEDGGFRGRSRESDLYYTVFGLECALGLGLEPPPRTRAFLRRHTPADLDFVHLTCLARCLEMVWPEHPAEEPELAELLKRRVASHACPGGGYHARIGKQQGSVYESFLGMLACESLGEPCGHPEQTIQRLEELRRSSGGFVNDSGLGAATTPVTAAALGLCWELGQLSPPGSLDWLLARVSSRGGFCAAPLVPMPDLLSTATALHALGRHGWLAKAPVDACLDFVTGLWDESGGFRGHALDGRADCEYTFYALLSLGDSCPGKPR